MLLKKEVSKKMRQILGNYMKTMNWTARRMAQYLDMSPQQFSNYMAGSRNFSDRALSSVQQALKLPNSWYMMDTEQIGSLSEIMPLPQPTLKTKQQYTMEGETIEICPLHNMSVMQAKQMDIVGIVVRVGPRRAKRKKATT